MILVDRIRPMLVPRPLSTASTWLHWLELIRDAVDHCGDTGKKCVNETLLVCAAVLRTGRNPEELRAGDGCLPELRPWTEVQDSRSAQDLTRLGVLDGGLATEDNADGQLTPVRRQHDIGHARRVHVGQRIDA